ncbi:MAG: L,D-transpeptidase [bacterium]|nr:L,D-transpeptidase [bacterium]
MLLRLLVATSVFALLATGSAFAEPAEETQASISKGFPETHAPYRKVIEQRVAEGETDVDELVDSIAAEGLEKLDHIIINVSTQTIYECNAAGQALRSSRISTGRKGYDTPGGKFKVENRSPKAYSQKYDAWMLNWMGFTADGNYGIHGLEGSSYERHLGSVASHGCVRLSRKYAKDLYTRIKVGMPVTIVREPDLKLADYKPISREVALDMVLEVLSPASPEQMFY